MVDIVFMFSKVVWSENENESWKEKRALAGFKYHMQKSYLLSFYFYILCKSHDEPHKGEVILLRIDVIQSNLIFIIP